MVSWGRRAPSRHHLGPEGPRGGRVLGSTKAPPKKSACLKCELFARHFAYAQAQYVQMCPTRCKARSYPIYYRFKGVIFPEVMAALKKYDDRRHYRNESFRTNEGCGPALRFDQSKTRPRPRSCIRARPLSRTTPHLMPQHDYQEQVCSRVSPENAL